MTRLDEAPEILELADELGVHAGAAPVDGLLGFCRQRIDGWIAEAGGVDDIESLEALVTQQLQMVFEEIRTDDDFDRITDKYARGMKEFVFATMRGKFDDDGNLTYGALIQRRNASPDGRDRFVAVIDCRGSKLARRFFTRWHEIAHRLTTHADLFEPVYRSEHDPLEKLMDEIAGHVGFFAPLFSPVMAKHHRGSRLSFATIEAIRQEFSSEASFQATLFACQRRLTTPLIYVEAGMGYKADEERKLNSKQKTLFEDDPPEEKLRVSMTVPNTAASDRKLQIIPKMRVPETSVIHRLFTNGDEDASGQENLKSWEFSSGGSLADCEVWIEARRLTDRVVAIVQPV